MTEAELRIKQLRIGFEHDGGFRWAVRGLDGVLKRGECVAVIGESGSGKSLTAAALLQLLPSTAWVGRDSRLEWKGRDSLSLTEHDARALRGTQVAWIVQEPMLALNPVRTVGSQLDEALARAHPDRNRSWRRERALNLMEEVGLSDPIQRYESYPHECSGGIKQRVVIAMALAGDPELLIADEPTTALDVTIQAQILELLRTLQRQKNMTLLLITHDLAVAKQIADRVVVMYAGEVVESASAEAFFKRPRHPYSQALLSVSPSMKTAQRHGLLRTVSGYFDPAGINDNACAFAPRCVHAQPLCQSPVYLTVSENEHAVRCVRMDELQGSPADVPLVVSSALDRFVAPLLQVEQLSVTYTRRGFLKKNPTNVKKAVNQVSLSLYEGKTLALVGESGCGKTSLAKAMLGLVPFSEGSVRYRGAPIQIMDRKKIQWIPQDPGSSLNPKMTIFEIVVEGLRAHRMADSEKEYLKQAETVLNQMGLNPAEWLYRFPHECSGGQKQRLVIARSVVMSPDILILDEPTSALDVSVQAQILNLLKIQQQEKKLSYVLVTHNMGVVAAMADDIAVMHQGQIVEYGPAQSILENPQHEYTRQLLAAVPRLD